MATKSRAFKRKGCVDVESCKTLINQIISRPAIVLRIYEDPLELKVRSIRTGPCIVMRTGNTSSYQKDSLVMVLGSNIEIRNQLIHLTSLDKKESILTFSSFYNQIYNDPENPETIIRGFTNLYWSKTNKLRIFKSLAVEYIYKSLVENATTYS